jgi:regulator of RNase E activity RraA
MSTNLGYRGFTEIRRPSPDLVARVAAYAPPDLSDVTGGAYTLDAAIRPIWPVPVRVAGPAVTVVAPQGSFNVIKYGMEQVKPGDVMVVNARGNDAYAVWGGNVSLGMKRRGCAGVIIDGAARDPEEAQEVEFPIFARSQGTAAPTLDGPGEVNVPIACGGCVVNPGDIIVADVNGIVVIPQDAAEWVLARVAELKDKHGKWRVVLQRGEVTNIANIIDGLKKTGFAIDGNVEAKG